MTAIKIYQRYARSKMRSVLLFCALFVSISVMAGSKVSELPDDDAIGGTEAFHVADSGADKRVTIDQVYNYVRSLFGTVIDSDTEDFEPADSTILKDADLGVSVQPYDADLTTWAGVTPGTGVATSLAQTTNAGTGVVTADNIGLLAAGAAAPSTTPSNVGDLFVDTSGDKLYFATGTASSADWIQANGEIPWQQCWTIAGPAGAYDLIVWREPTATTLTAVNAISIGGGSISVDLRECDSAGSTCATVLSAAITADGGTDAGTISDSVLAAGGTLQMVLGAPTGTVDSLLLCAGGTQSW